MLFRHATNNPARILWNYFLTRTVDAHYKMIILSIATDNITHDLCVCQPYGNIIVANRSEALMQLYVAGLF